MGDVESGPVRPSFNSQLHVEFRGATVSSTASEFYTGHLAFHAVEAIPVICSPPLGAGAACLLPAKAPMSGVHHR
jgi:hypothetical protein